MAKKAKKGLCTYCLRWREVTRDHVPPKAFFAKHRPDDLITVPACDECHRPTSDDDEYTASVIALRMESGDIPDAQARRQAFLRSLKRPEKRRFRRSFMNDVRDVRFRSPAGLDLGEGGIYMAKYGKIVPVVARTVRGLWRHHHDDVPLPVDARVEVYPFEHVMEDLKNPDAPNLAKIVRVLLEAPYQLVGDGGTFRYKYEADPTEPMATAWFIEFYMSTGFVCTTVPRHLLEEVG